MKASFLGKFATIVFDENVLSAQELARAVYHSKHMMGPDMQYGGFLLLSVPGAKTKATGAKATAAVSKVKGVAKAVFFPQQKAVAIQFTDRGKATSAELISALDEAGFKAGQYGAKIKKK